MGKFLEKASNLFGERDASVLEHLLVACILACQATWAFADTQGADPSVGRTCRGIGLSGVDASVLPIAQRYIQDTKRVFLVVERDRIIGCNARNKTFREHVLAANEKVLKTAETDLIAIVATNRRYFAYSAFSAPWHVAPRVANERFVSLRAEGSVALLVTSRRVLTFDGQRAKWAAGSRR